MILSWWRRWRRKRVLAEPFPGEWAEILDRNLIHYRRLSEDERAALRRRVQVFVAEKYWEGVSGFAMSDEIKVTVAGAACLLVLGLENEFFDRLLSIIVYPDQYAVKETQRNPAGVVTEGHSFRLGEAWYGGPIVLAWENVLADCRRGGRSNVVLHEFAHYLDMQDSAIDGTPPLDDPQQYATWREVMTAEYERLVRDSRSGRRTLLDEYGTTDEAEFFAVATECFFGEPVRMRTRHPQLYAVLQEFYRQNPADRIG